MVASLTLMWMSVAVTEGCAASPAYVTPTVGLPQAPAGGTTPVAAAATTAEPLTTSSANDDVLPVPAVVADLQQPHFDPRGLGLVTEDPRLSLVKKEGLAGRPKAAAEALSRALGTLPDEAPERAAWQYQLGLRWMAAGQPARAVVVFDLVAARDGLLADHARMHAARALMSLRQAGEALSRIESIAPERVANNDHANDEMLLLWARVLAAVRRVDEAAPLWRSYLQRSPRPGGWRHVALRFARALLNQPSLQRAEEAVSVARLVIYESRAGLGSGEARELEKRALSSLPANRRKGLMAANIVDLVDRARGLGDSRQGREAIRAADKLIDVLRADGGADSRPSEASCEAYVARGRGLSALRRHAEASDAYGLAATRCEGLPRQVYALFLGGRSALRGGQPAVARLRYAELERRFPKHRFADDARLHGARAVAMLGDAAVFTRMLSTIADDYPDGDMLEDGLFALALARIKEGNWAAAVGPLERAVALSRPASYYARGRAAYFLARARLALGLKRQGLAGLERVIRDHPLSYYMALAYSRLAHFDEARARATLQKATAREPRGEFVIADHPSLRSLPFRRAVALARQGDAKRALGELRPLLDRGAPPPLLWASAFVLAQSEAPAESHGVLRAAPGEWTRHYPAGVWRRIWEIAYPRPYAKIVERERARSPIPEHLAYAIMREESAFRPGAVSPARAYGLMQLIMPTARSVGRKLGMKVTRKSLHDPAVNIALGSRFLSILSKRFSYNPLLAIPGYNAGPGAPRRWVKKRGVDDFDVFVETIPYRETRRYTKRVIRTMAAYATLYGKGMDGAWLRLPEHVAPPQGS